MLKPCSRQRTWERHDPEAQAEARKYAHPVPSRTYIRQYLEDQGVPVPFDGLVDAFGLGPRKRRALGVRLKAMVRDGQILRNRREGYCLVDRIALVTGVVSAHRDSFGFVVPDQDGADDVYLSPRAMREPVDMEQRRIDFEPAEPKARSGSKRTRGKLPDKRVRGRRRATRSKENRR